MIVRPAKDTKILDKIRERVPCGDYVLTEHAVQRMAQRDVTEREMRYVLMTGYRESKKDEFKLGHRSWVYAMRGKSFDGRELRIAVGFDEDDMLIVTVIDLEM